MLSGHEGGSSHGGRDDELARDIRHVGTTTWDVFSSHASSVARILEGGRKGMYVRTIIGSLLPGTFKKWGTGEGIKVDIRHREEVWGVWMHWGPKGAIYKLLALERGSFMVGYPEATSYHGTRSHKKDFMGEFWKGIWWLVIFRDYKETYIKEIMSCNAQSRGKIDNIWWRMHL